MICHSPNWWNQNHRRNNPEQVDIRIAVLHEAIEQLRDFQAETDSPRLSHEAEALESILWTRIGVLL